jgi:hypothetical protein
MGMTQGDSEDRILDGSPDGRRRLKPCNPELKGEGWGGQKGQGGRHILRGRCAVNCSQLLAAYRATRQFQMRLAFTVHIRRVALNGQECILCKHLETPTSVTPGQNSLPAIPWPWRSCLLARGRRALFTLPFPRYFGGPEVECSRVSLKTGWLGGICRPASPDEAQSPQRSRANKLSLDATSLQLHSSRATKQVVCSV